MANLLYYHIAQMFVSENFDKFDEWLASYSLNFFLPKFYICHAMSRQNPPKLSKLLLIFSLLDLSKSILIILLH